MAKEWKWIHSTAQVWVYGAPPYLLAYREGTKLLRQKATRPWVCTTRRPWRERRMKRERDGEGRRKGKARAWEATRSLSQNQTLGAGTRLEETRSQDEKDEPAKEEEERQARPQMRPPCQAKQKWKKATCVGQEGDGCFTWDMCARKRCVQCWGKIGENTKGEGRHTFEPAYHSSHIITT